MRGYTRTWRAEYRERGESYDARWRTPEQLAAGLAQAEATRTFAARKDGWQRRRAQKRQAPTERFRHGEVFERDGWICQLCKKPVDRKLKYPHPRSASLDHVIPLAPPHNGHHTRENTQLAHLSCNNAKGARLEGDDER